VARLPNADRAILDIRKIENYCLNALHPHGRHKARAFRAALGIGSAEAEWLRGCLLDGVRIYDATQIGSDRFGSRWRVDIAVSHDESQATVRSVWIIRIGEAVPRLVTCWIR
jgi:hypothetical protein